jgi:hypothetical protein
MLPAIRFLRGWWLGMSSFIYDCGNSFPVSEVFTLLYLRNHVSLKYRAQTLVLVLSSHKSDSGSNATDRMFRTVSVCAGRVEVNVVCFSRLG